MKRIKLSDLRSKVIAALEEVREEREVQFIKSMNIQIATGSITDFEGDIIIIPCDSELTYNKSFYSNPNYPLFRHESKKSLIKNLFEKAGKELVQELTTIGYCEIGYAVTVQGYELKARKIIFMPISDHNSEGTRINYVILHQSLRAAFTLANLYKAKSVAIAGIHIPNKRKNFFISIWDKYFGNNSESNGLGSDEIEDIIISTSKNLVNSSIKKLVIYKYSK